MLVRVSRDQYLFVNSPKLFADFHALHRLLTPRHPPCALSNLTTEISNSLAPIPTFRSDRPRASGIIVGARFDRPSFISVRLTHVNHTRYFILSARFLCSDKNPFRSLSSAQPASCRTSNSFELNARSRCLLPINQISKDQLVCPATTCVAGSSVIYARRLRPSIANLNSFPIQLRVSAGRGDVRERRII